LLFKIRVKKIINFKKNKIRKKNYQKIKLSITKLLKLKNQLVIYYKANERIKFNKFPLLRRSTKIKQENLLKQKIL